MKTRTDRKEQDGQIWADRVLIVLLAASLIGALIQITMGGAVRVTGSGDGCPDWPTCFGNWLPPFEYHAMMEYTHRTIGVLVGLTIIAAVLRVWVKHRGETSVVSSATAGLIAVSITGGIGGAVVLSELDPGLRTLHLLLAESVLLLMAHALVATVYLRSSGRDAGLPRGLVLKALAGSAMTLIALLSGSYAVWRGAGAVCPSWPLCGGSIIPQYELVWIHVTHRVLALISVFPAMGAAHMAMKVKGGSESSARALRILGIAISVIIVTQVLLGAANPWTGFAQWARVSHLTFASLQWVSMCLMTLLVLLPVARRSLADVSERDEVSKASISGAVA
ncbi:MAG: heme A synthase [Chloroflexi bacterium]|nr:heme A synthase [Chloroflexota bacterium]